MLASLRWLSSLEMSYWTGCFAVAQFEEALVHMLCDHAQDVAVIPPRAIDELYLSLKTPSRKDVEERVERPFGGERFVRFDLQPHGAFEGGERLEGGRRLKIVLLKLMYGVFEGGQRSFASPLLLRSAPVVDGEGRAETLERRGGFFGSERVELERVGGPDRDGAQADACAFRMRACGHDAVLVGCAPVIGIEEQTIEGSMGAAAQPRSVVRDNRSIMLALYSVALMSLLEGGAQSDLHDFDRLEAVFATARFSIERVAHSAYR